MYESTFAGEKVCTHGPDEVGATRPTASRAASFPGEPVRGSRIPCYKDGPYVRILYVYDGNNRLNDAAPSGRRALIREAVALADDMFYSAGKASGGYRRVRWRMSSTCKLTITPMHSNSTWLFTIGQQALERGKMKPSEHAVAIVETPGCMGLGQTYDDQRPGSSNLHNRGPFIATVNAGCIIDGSAVVSSAQVLAHELLHTLGAVQDGAPNSTKAMHCHDEWDVMCYADGGSRDTIDKVCTPKMVPEQLDCRKNDYFNVSPRNGSYLDEHWNTARSAYLARKGPARWDRLKRPKPVLNGVPNGANIAGGLTVGVDVTAPPDAGIHHVNLVVDGKGAGQDTKAPFSFSLDTRDYKNGKKLDVQAIAVDRYNRPGASAVRRITPGNPTIHLETPVDQMMFTGGTLAWSATAKAYGGRTVTKVDLQAVSDSGTSIVDSVESGIGGVFSGSFPTAGLGGIYQVRARVTDSSGAWRWTPYRTMTSGELPTVTLLSPGFDFPTVDGAILLAADAEPAIASDTGIDRVEFLADGIEVAEDTTAPYWVSWDPPGTSDSFEISARVVDDGGATDTTFAATLTEDPSDHQLTESVSGSSGSVTLTASPTMANGATSTDVYFYVDGALAGVDSASPYSVSWDSREVANGPHVMRATMFASDGDSLSSAGELFTTTNDDVALSFVQAPAEGSTFRGTQTLDIDANNAAGHDILGVTWYANGLQIGYTAGAGSIQWNTTDQYQGLSDGAVTLRARAEVLMDGAFVYYTTEATRTAVLRNTYAKVTAPGSGQNVGGRFDLRATAKADKDASVDWVYFYVDGVYVGRDGTSPYALEWRSGTVSDGNHTVTATVFTNDGRSATSSGVSFST